MLPIPRQEDLAARVSLTRTSIVNIEKGRQKLLIHTLILIGRALKVGPTQLLCGLGESEESVLLQEIPETVAPNIRDWIIKSVKRASSITKPLRKQ